MSESCWSVYIIRCREGSLYTGIATDVERRFEEHVSQGPKAAKYLRGRLPLEIVYRKEIGSRSEASKEEMRIKRMGVKGKMGLVNGGCTVNGKKEVVGIPGSDKIWQSGACHGHPETRP
jgi:putative endonuclease